MWWLSARISATAAVTVGAGFAFGHNDRSALISRAEMYLQLDETRMRSAMYIGSLTRGGHVSEMVVLMQRNHLWFLCSCPRHLLCYFSHRFSFEFQNFFKVVSTSNRFQTRTVDLCFSWFFSQNFSSSSYFHFHWIETWRLPLVPGNMQERFQQNAHVCLKRKLGTFDVVECTFDQKKKWCWWWWIWLGVYFL